MLFFIQFSYEDPEEGPQPRPPTPLWMVRLLIWSAIGTVVIPTALSLPDFIAGKADGLISWIIMHVSITANVFNIAVWANRDRKRKKFRPERINHTTPFWVVAALGTVSIAGAIAMLFKIVEYLNLTIDKSPAYIFLVLAYAILVCCLVFFSKVHTQLLYRRLRRYGRA